MALIEVVEEATVRAYIPFTHQSQRCFGVCRPRNIKERNLASRLIRNQPNRLIASIESRSARRFAGVEFGGFFNRRAGFAEIRTVILDRFKILFDAVQNFID